MESITILAIETSCDETAAAVVKNGHCVLSNVISSQIKIHEKYGGVVPEIASRNHMEKISQVIDEALANADVTFEKIDAIAVTSGPGLVGALLVGISYAKSLAFSLKKPLIGVHHIDGHICANYITNKNFTPPFICLVASGGHTNIILVKKYGIYTVLGKTLDDAAGEAYDKVARALGLSYPGGPKIDELSRYGNNEAVFFPRAYINDESLDFSFSGIKSSVINFINKSNMSGVEIVKADVAASFQQAVIEVLVKKTILACKLNGVTKVAMAGGVSSNSALQELMRSTCDLEKFELNLQPSIYCTDNAAMIGAAAHFYYKSGTLQNNTMNACPSILL
jgi:N6-L-threonylcarbamoyladenine synthase